jgi:hypothetical protein
VAFLLVSKISPETLSVLTLILPHPGIETNRERRGAIYSLVMKERHDANATYTDLSTVLRVNDPSEAEHKRQSDTLGSTDPVIEHLMSFKAFKAVVWSFIAAVTILGLSIIAHGIFGNLGSTARVGVLLYGGPGFVLSVLLSTAIAMMSSRRLR